MQTEQYAEALTSVVENLTAAKSMLEAGNELGFFHLYSAGFHDLPSTFHFGLASYLTELFGDQGLQFRWHSEESDERGQPFFEVVQGNMLFGYILMPDRHFVVQGHVFSRLKEVDDVLSVAATLNAIKSRLPDDWTITIQQK